MGSSRPAGTISPGYACGRPPSRPVTVSSSRWASWPAMRVPFRGCPAVTAAGAPPRFATTGDPKSPNIINHSARAPVEFLERDLGYGGALARLCAGRLSAL